MNPLKIVTLESNHLDEIVGTLPPMLGELESLKKVATVDGYAFSGLIGEKVIGCAGILPIWPGVGEAWVVIPMLPLGLLRQVCRVTRDLLPDIMADKNLHRVQASVPRNFPAALKFARILGFRPEGLMQAYGIDQTDYERFAIVRKNG